MNKQPCPYCQHGKPLNDVANSNFAITIINDCILAEYDYDYSEQESVEINYCPMCGRKLEVAE